MGVRFGGVGVALALLGAATASGCGGGASGSGSVVPTPAPTATIAAAATPMPIPAPRITEFPLPTANAGPINIVAGPDGALWFIEAAAPKIGRISTDGLITEYSVPNSSGGNGLTVGPDGALWFTDSNGFVGRMTTAGVVTNEYPVSGGGGSSLNEIATGSDGNLWVVFDPSQVIKMTPSGAMTFITYSSSPVGAISLTAARDGAIWLGESTLPGQVVRIPTSGNGITPYTVATASQGSLGSIISGPDGNLWASDSGDSAILKITPGGMSTFFAIPSAALGQHAVKIANGPDGNLYFSDIGFSDGIGQITTSGLITIFALGGSPLPFGLAAGSDGNVWFTEELGNRIGKLLLH